MKRRNFSGARAGHTDFHPFTLDGLEDTIEKIGDAPVYFTVDLDVMDPSVFPGTGTPEPGGTDFLTVMRSVTKVCEKVNLIGCDVNELCPPCDPTGASTAVACKIIRGDADRNSQSYKTSKQKKGAFIMGKVMVIGCGGVASVAIHKICQNSEVFSELCIASRTVSKCDALKEKLQDTTKTKITTRAGRCRSCRRTDSTDQKGEAGGSP